MIDTAIHWLLALLAMPKVGMSSVFLISLVSATLLPLGSEPAVFAAVKAAPHMFWPLIGIATLGNTLGGVIDYWIGYGAKRAIASEKPQAALLTPSPQVRQTYAVERSRRWYGWLERHGAKTMLLAWLPGIGDPVCTLAGWLRLPFWPSVGYMAVGKFLRYLGMTWLLMEVPDGFWHRLGALLA